MILITARRQLLRNQFRHFLSQNIKYPQGIAPGPGPFSLIFSNVLDTLPLRFDYHLQATVMELQEHIDYWLKSAAHDLETAEVLFSENRYDWCLFLGHLVIEKMLKAFYVRDSQNQTPPFTHNLSVIAASTKLDLTPEQEELLLALNQFNIRTRYPDYKLQFYKKCP